MPPRPQHLPTRRAPKQPIDQLNLDPRLLGAYDQHRVPPPASREPSRRRSIRREGSRAFRNPPSLPTPATARPDDQLREHPRACRNQASFNNAQAAGQVKLEAAARELWWHAYPQLTRPADGLAGDLTARAEAHTIRLALLYALLDGQRQINTEHLTAALALSDYTARSAAWALGQATGDPLAEQIHAALTRSPDGLTRTQISQLLHRSLPVHQLQQALDTLAAAGRAHPTKITTAGRPAELWHATPQPVA